MPESRQTRLEKLLGRRSKSILIELFAELAADDVVFGDWLLQRLERDGDATVPLATAGVGPAESASRITRADYGSIARGLDSLLHCSALAPLLALAPSLLAFASADAARQPGSPEVAAEANACFTIVFKGLQRIDWRPVEKLIWYWDLLLLDRYSLLEALPAPVNEALLPAQDWREAAEYFQIRLGEAIQSGGQGHYAGAAVQRRDLIANVSTALVQMGEIDATTDVLMAELPHTLCYPELVHHLSDHGFSAEAESWARQGFAVTAQHRPDIAWTLEHFLATLARQRGDALLVAAFRVDEFLAQPSVLRYRRLRAAVDDPQRWELVQLQLLAWLEFGDPPAASPEWPLPATGLALYLDNHPIHQHERHFVLLVEILLDEDEIDYALQCFERMHWRRDIAQRIADAGLDSRPDISRQLLEQIVESWIDEVRVKSYQQAAQVLRQLQAVCLQHHWQAAFNAFVKRLRERHAAKQRMLEILDEVEASPPVTLRLVKHSQS